MTTVKDILNWVQTLAPAYMKGSWDNVGLLCGDPRKPVTRVLVALDPFEHVCKEAEDVGAELIVTHHPLPMPSMSLKENSYCGDTALKLLRFEGC